MTANNIPRPPLGCPPQAWLTVIRILQFYDKQGINWRDKETGRSLGLIARDIVYARKGDGVAQVKLQFDAERLPPGITKKDVLKPEIIATLPYIVHGDVYVEDKHGLALVVDFERKRDTEARLPAIVPWSSDFYPPAKRGMWFPVGYCARGPFWMRLQKLTHLLVMGQTKGGKSTWFHMMLYWLLSSYTPEQLRLFLIDAKDGERAVEFNLWGGVPHLLGPVAANVDEVLDCLSRLDAEIARRNALFADARATDIDDYQHLTGKRLPELLCVFDEWLAFSDRLPRGKARDEFMMRIKTMVKTARSVGLHLVLGAQDLKADDLPTSASGQFSHRIAFRIELPHIARLLQMPGAETITRPGRFLTTIGGMQFMQGFLVEKDAIRTLAAKLVAQAQVPPSQRRQLTDDELRMCQIARDMLDGNFTVGDDKAKTGIYGAVGPKKHGGFSKRLIENTGRNLEARGLLAKVGGENGQGWVMLPELLDIVKSDEQIKEGEGR